MDPSSKKAKIVFSTGYIRHHVERYVTSSLGLQFGAKTRAELMTLIEDDAKNDEMSWFELKKILESCKTHLMIGRANNGINRIINDLDWEAKKLVAIRKAADEWNAPYAKTS